MPRVLWAFIGAKRRALTRFPRSVQLSNKNGRSLIGPPGPPTFRSAVSF